MILALIFSVEEDVIQVYNNKDIKFFWQDLIDITLEASLSVR